MSAQSMTPEGWLPQAEAGRGFTRATCRPAISSSCTTCAQDCLSIPPKSGGSLEGNDGADVSDRMYVWHLEVRSKSRSA
jgi:hypothetical protein